MPGHSASVCPLCVCVRVCGGVWFLKSAQQPPTIQQQVFMSPILKGTKETGEHAGN